MMTLNGTYAESGELNYVCRAFRYKDSFFDGVGQPLEIRDGDVLMMLGQGTWFALYRAAGVRSIARRRQKKNTTIELRDRPPAAPKK